MKLNNKQRIGVWVLFAGLCIGFGVLAHHVLTPATQIRSQFHGTWLDKPREIPIFELLGSDQKPFNNQSLHGHWTFLFFGFTHCESVCPITMAELAKVYRLVGEQKDLSHPQIVMITLDPKRDNMTRVRQYVQAFNPDFLGVRGTLPDVKSLAKNMGIAYARVVSNDKQPQHYSIEHTGAIMLINPNAELVAFFTPPHQAASIVSDYRLLNSL